MARHDHSDDGDADEHDAESADPSSERLAEARRRVALAQIRQYGDPVLRMRAYEIDAFDDELKRVSERMLELMHDSDGVGLAATQVGILRRLFVFNDDGVDRVLVNPAITSSSGAVEVDSEGCLSLGPVRVPVERATSITLEAKDVSGDDVHLDLDGLSARVVQHELDHLDGKLIIDRTDPASRREALGVLRPRVVLSSS
jgi:peptide deformylase